MFPTSVKAGRRGASPHARAHGLSSPPAHRPPSGPPDRSGLVLVEPAGALPLRPLLRFPLRPPLRRPPRFRELGDQGVAGLLQLLHAGDVGLRPPRRRRHLVGAQVARVGRQLRLQAGRSAGAAPAAPRSPRSPPRGRGGPAAAPRCLPPVPGRLAQAIATIASSRGPNPASRARCSASAAICSSSGAGSTPAATNVPWPWWLTTSPSCSSPSYTARTVFTLTPAHSASRRKLGSRSPAAS